MKVVLTKTIEHLGVIGDTKDVKPGYARNYLFPKRLAILPADKRAKTYRAERASALEALNKQRAIIGELANQWRGQSYTVKARASEEGSLYGSVGAKEIRKLLGREDVDIEVPTLKTVGTHAIDVRLADGTTFPITVTIVADNATA